MTFKQILTFDLNRVLQFDVNRILRWDVGAALTRPVTNPFLKFGAGWLVGIYVFLLGSVILGVTPSDRVINLLSVALGVVCAFTPNGRSLGRSENAQRPVL